MKVNTSTVHMLAKTNCVRARENEKSYLNVIRHHRNRGKGGITDIYCSTFAPPDVNYMCPGKFYQKKKVSYLVVFGMLSLGICG